MDKLIKIGIDKAIPRQMAKLAIVNADPNAERFIVLNRRSMAVLRHGSFANGHTQNCFFALGYENRSDLLLLIVDDDEQFNAKAMDGIQAELGDANEVG
ncbi:hypothetical protein MJ923_07915 [Shewanella sp. 3B26]|uniref:Uncharacterized protein n=1 Tax=Shewanella zhuhaiensis TaxID=2919576 RepID=A0AAJ1FAM2_9GAMM|nr:hypothetical protein [Shewanella zhuhaiensis]MCH4294230.1 hypothetical protein [Shewanella zhuhaiensis]